MGERRGKRRVARQRMRRVLPQQIARRRRPQMDRETDARWVLLQDQRICKSRTLDRNASRKTEDSCSHHDYFQRSGNGPSNQRVLGGKQSLSDPFEYYCDQGWVELEWIPEK